MWISRRKSSITAKSVTPNIFEKCRDMNKALTVAVPDMESFILIKSKTPDTKKKSYHRSLSTN